MLNMQALFFENLPFGVVKFLVAVRTIAFERRSWFIAVIKWRVLKGILILFNIARLVLIFIK